MNHERHERHETGGNERFLLGAFSETRWSAFQHSNRLLTPFTLFCAVTRSFAGVTGKHILAEKEPERRVSEATRPYFVSFVLFVVTT